MAFALSSAFLIFLLVLLPLRYLYTTITKARKDAKFRAFALANHCEEPPLQKNKLPYGIDRLIEVTTFKGDILDDLVAEGFRREGYTFKAQGLGGEVISTVEPQNIQTILALRFTDFELGSKRKRNFAPLLGNGIFTADGPEWEHSRAFLRPQFSREQISDLEATERHVGNLFQALGTVSEGMWTKEVDLQELFYKFTLDTATEFLFGESTESQLAGLSGRQGGDEEGDSVNSKSKSKLAAATKSAGSGMDFATAFNVAQDFLSWQLRIPEFLWPITQLPVFSSYRRYAQSLNIVHSLVNQYVDLAIHPEFRTATAKGPAPSSSLPSGGAQERFVMLEALAEKTQDRDELRDQLLQVLLAGRDTTAALLSWSFVLLAQHPAIFDSLRSAILSTFGISEPPNNHAPITFSTLKSCRPLVNFLHEVLRLYPVVPWNFRVAARDSVLPTGGGPDRKSPIAIKKGQVVTYAIYFMHRSPDIWGEDALEFKPERWEGRKIGWEYLPFNGGPRVCLGREFPSLSSGKKKP
jgi:cytochrome P450